MIPISGNVSELTGSSEPAKSGAKGAETGAVGGVFGDILSAAKVSGTASSAQTGADASGGKFLPTGGNLLPSSVAADSDVVSTEFFLAGVRPPQTELTGDSAAPLGIEDSLDGTDVPLESSLPASDAVPQLDAALLDASVLLPADGISSGVTSDIAGGVTGAVVTAINPEELDLKTPLPTELSADIEEVVVPPPPLAPTALPVNTAIPAATSAISPIVLAPEAQAASGVRPAVASGVASLRGERGEPTGTLLAAGMASQGTPNEASRGLPLTAVVADKVILENAELAALADGSTQKPVNAPQTQSPTSGLISPTFSVESTASSSKLSVLPPRTVPLGEPEWGPELAGRVSLMVKNGMPEASLQLNPPELGRLDIRITTEGDQTRVQFAVANADARDAIEQSMPRLREMLEQSGLQLARSDVGDQSQSRQSSDSPTNANSSSGAVEGEVHADITSQQVDLGDSRSQVDYYV